MNYTTYQSILRSLKDVLGLSCIQFWDTSELHKYAEIVLGYLNSEILGQDPQDNLAAIKALCDTIDQGNRIFLEGSVTDLKYIMGITEDPEEWSDVLFGVAWANVCTSLWESAKCNYAGVLWELEHQGCECWCGCSDEVTEEDNLYTKLVGNGASFSEDPKGSSGCGCGA
jgi:hypothetical protein